ncbi:unnamed protein product [Ixodes pacificus]
MSPRWLCLAAVFLVECRCQQRDSPERTDLSAFFASPSKQEAAVADRRGFARFRNVLLGREPYRSPRYLDVGPGRRGGRSLVRRRQPSFFDSTGLEKRFPEVDQRGFHEDIFEESFGDFSPVK